MMLCTILCDGAVGVETQMKYDVQKSQTSVSFVGDAEIRGLARRAIGVVAAGKPSRETPVSERLSALSDASISTDVSACHAVLTRLREEGIGAGDIIDTVIPAAARLLGDRWFRDEISFADVTIGTARLQESVRALAARDDSRGRKGSGGTPTRKVLLVLPRGEDHSLGVIVLADQFRRLGYQVTVAVDRHPRQIVDLIQKDHFAMVGISVSGRRTLASAKDMVEKIRESVTRFVPVVLGGPYAMTNPESLSVTQADHVVVDAPTALKACGLPMVGERRAMMLTESQPDVAAGRGETE